MHQFVGFINAGQNDVLDYKTINSSGAVAATTEAIRPATEVLEKVSSLRVTSEANTVKRNRIMKISRHRPAHIKKSAAPWAGHESSRQ